MNVELQILSEFKKALIQFFDELIDQFPEEGEIVIIRIFLKDQIPIVDVMNYFIKEFIPLKQLIEEKNEKFFLENTTIFSKINKSKVMHFKKLWRSGRLDNEDKEVIWKWLTSFIFLSEKYQSIKELNATTSV